MKFRFGIASDLHVAVPATLPGADTTGRRFHRVEVGIAALERAIESFLACDLDFLLLPGDLTQDGEPENHAWLQQRLESLPFPTYVIPGNHDVLTPEPTATNIGAHQFPDYYRKCGYQHASGDRLHYTCELLPGVQLVALNSNTFDASGRQRGCLDAEQLAWLAELLPTLADRFVLVTIHHNVLEHFPGQAAHPLGRRYMLENAPHLCGLLRDNGVKLVCTGHLHVQDLASEAGLHDLVTGSLVSYPHPYRVVDVEGDARGPVRVRYRSFRVESVPGEADLQQSSRQWLGDRFYPFVSRLLAEPPLNLPASEVERLAPHLRYFWADLAAGDATCDVPALPSPVREYFARFGTQVATDNCATLEL